MALKSMNLSKWQDYRGKSEGILIYLNTSSQTALPVRDIMNEFGKGHQTEPHYETGTFGFMSCVDTKLRAAAFKNRRRYLFFGTSYQGTEEAFKGKYLLVGYMRLDKSLEVRKRHMHHWMEDQEGNSAPECLDLHQCISFYSSEMNFYALEDCFELTEEVMKGWGYKGRVAKHMKLSFSEKNTGELLEHFSSKTPITDSYAQLSIDMEQEKERILVESEQEEEEEDTEEW